MKQTIRKSDLKRLVESAMNELDWKTYMNASDKNEKWLNDSYKAAREADFEANQLTYNFAKNDIFGGNTSELDNIWNSIPSFEDEYLNSHEYYKHDRRREEFFDKAMDEFYKKYGYYPWEYEYDEGYDKKGIEDYDRHIMGKSKYKKGKGWTNESINRRRTIKKSQLKRLVEGIIRETYGKVSTPEKVKKQIDKIYRSGKMFGFDWGEDGYIQLGYDPQRDILYGGGTTNNGVVHDFEIQYNHSFPLWQNVEAMYDEIGMKIGYPDFWEEEEDKIDDSQMINKDHFAKYVGKAEPEYRLKATKNEIEHTPFGDYEIDEHGKGKLINKITESVIRRLRGRRPSRRR